jgi:regulator of protease activity HflC (stomatin/prohibitin superfamily)
MPPKKTGELIKTKNEAEARKQQYILEGEGEAKAIKLRAEAYAESIRAVALSLGEDKGLDAAKGMFRHIHTHTHRCSCTSDEYV